MEATAQLISGKTEILRLLEILLFFLRNSQQLHKEIGLIKIIPESESWLVSCV